MANTGCNGHHAKKQCTSGGDCDCCKHHSNYSIKENLKPGLNQNLAQANVLAIDPALPGFIFHSHLAAVISAKVDCTAGPPWQPG